MAHNAVERLWKAREAGNFGAIEALLHKDIKISLPAQGMNPGRERFTTMMHIMHGPGTETKLNQVIVGSGLDIASRAEIRRGEALYLCLGIYHLQEGLIRSIEESWIRADDAHFDFAWLAES